MTSAHINIPLNDTLRSLIQNILDERAISVSDADNLLLKIAFAIVQQKNAIGLYSDSEYLMSIPGMQDIIEEGLSTPISECFNEDELCMWTHYENI